MAKIYALVDARNPEHFRYVGKTIYTIERRLYWHLYKQPAEKNLYKKRWIVKVQDAGGDVLAVLLEECPDELQDEREMFWIAKAKADGHRLTNMSDGGEGGRNPCPEVRERIAAHHRGKKRPPHVVEALRKSGRRYVGAANPNFGKHHTAEARARIGAAHKGRKLTDAHKKKCSDRLKGVNAGSRNGSARLTAEQVTSIYRRKVFGKERVVDLAREFGIHQMSVYPMLQGKTWSSLNLLQMVE